MRVPLLAAVFLLRGGGWQSHAHTQKHKMHFFSFLFLILFSCWLGKKRSPGETLSNLKINANRHSGWVLGDVSS